MLQTLFFNISVDSTCSKFWISSIIISKDNTAKLKANITGNKETFPVNTVVKLDCLSASYRINGSDISRCLSNGSWDNIPTCVLRTYHYLLCFFSVF